MAYLVMFHWGWLVASFFLGLAMGWISVVQHGEGLSKTASRSVVALIVVLVGLAAAKVVPGRFGYWLDLGLILFGCYLVGCTIGSLLRYWVVSRQRVRAAG
jgi:hypothetical protein